MRTALYDRHCALGAKMVDFCGWEMPLQYQGIIPEHHAVRERVGIFDVSHMGRILVQGPQSAQFLDYISTNSITAKPSGAATYTVLCMADGGCVDDVIVYTQDTQRHFVIVNACNRQKDIDHLQCEARAFDVHIEDRYAQDGILAIQGPNAKALVGRLFQAAQDLHPMHFAAVVYEGVEIILSATGYTGAGGFEIYAPNTLIVKLWDYFIKEGAQHGIMPVGLGARDSLRLEMGYALYGHEISEEIAPNESVSAWTVKWDKPDFLGKSSLESIENSLEKRSEYGVILIDQGIARAGYEVYKDNMKIGIVTSGGYSPTLDQAIAIVLIKGSVSKEDIVDIQIRQQRCKAKVVSLPFVKPHRS